MTLYRVAVMQYNDIKLELEFTTWTDAMEFMENTLRTTTEYVSFHLETFQGERHE
jgi:hypothetical protein